LKIQKTNFLDWFLTVDVFYCSGHLQGNILFFGFVASTKKNCEFSVCVQNNKIILR